MEIKTSLEKLRWFKITLILVLIFFIAIFLINPISYIIGFYQNPYEFFKAVFFLFLYTFVPSLILGFLYQYILQQKLKIPFLLISILGGIFITAIAATENNIFSKLLDIGIDLLSFIWSLFGYELSSGDGLIAVVVGLPFFVIIMALLFFIVIKIIYREGVFRK